MPGPHWGIVCCMFHVIINPFTFFYFKSQLFNTLQRSLFKLYWSWDLLSTPLKPRICTTVVTAPFSVSNLCTLEVIRLTEDLRDVDTSIFGEAAILKVTSGGQVLDMTVSRFGWSIGYHYQYLILIQEPG